MELPKQLEEALLKYTWPGNVRQLRNFAEKVSVLFTLNQDHADIIEDLIGELTPGMHAVKANDTQLETSNYNQTTLKKAEAASIKACWEANNRNISRTARQLGLDRSTVRKNLVEPSDG